MESSEHSREQELLLQAKALDAEAGLELSSEANTPMEKLKRNIVIAIAFIGAVWHLYMLSTHMTMDVWVFRMIHLNFAAILIVLMKPTFRTRKHKFFKMSGFAWDLIILGISIGCTLYITNDFMRIVQFMDFSPRPMDTYVFIMGAVVVMDVTYRMNGKTMPMLAFIFLVYCFVGPYIPGVLGHKGYSLARVATVTISTNGIYGIPISISATYLILFVIFGSLLEATGGDKLFIDTAIGTVGRYRGGPAKAAIFASAGFGTINGSSPANVVTTGVITIPLMKKVGYNPVFSGAVEAVASTGGQILPPVMGAGAFVMAETLGVPYSEVAKAAVMPAIMYFLSLYVMVDIEALKLGLKGVNREDVPDVKAIWIKYGHLIIPIAIVFYCLFVARYTPLKSGLYASYVLLVIALLRKYTRYGPRELVRMLASGMTNAAGVISACACAGIIIGALSLTGAATRLVAIIIGLSGGNTMLILFYTMLVTLVMGCGLPTTAAYIITATVAAPALIQIGITPMQAHMFIFYYACLSAITPPIAIASYAAAGITGESVHSTSFKAMQLGLAAYIVPYMFIFSEAILMIGSTGLVIRSTITCIIGIICFGQAIAGWFLHRSNLLVRGLQLVVALLLIDQGDVTDALGLAILAGCFVLQKYVFKNKTEQLAV